MCATLFLIFSHISQSLYVSAVLFDYVSIFLTLINPQWICILFFFFLVLLIFFLSPTSGHGTQRLATSYMKISEVIFS